MGHWFLANFPWKTFSAYVVFGYAILSSHKAHSDAFALFIILGGLSLICYTCISMVLIHEKFERNITNIIIPEFIEKRPFREIDSGRKEAILQEILESVNNKVQLKIGTNYSYSTTLGLVDKYNQCMKTFDDKFNKLYRKFPVEDNIWDKFMSETNINCENEKLNKSFRGQPIEIRGWDKIMLVARNIENEDIEYVMSKMYSPELIQSYGTIRKKSTQHDK